MHRNRSDQDPPADHARTALAAQGDILTALFALLALILFVGVIRGQVALIMVGILLMGASIVFALWSRLAVGSLSYRRFFDPPRIFAGETSELVTEVSNHAWLPMPWVRIYERFPGAVVPAQSRAEGSDGRGGGPRVTAESWYRRRSLSLAWRERVTTRERMTCARRGYYTIGPTDLETGDPTGLFAEHVRIGETRELIVYPRLAAIPDLHLSSGAPFGNRKAPPPTIEDPAQFAGVRDYRPGDPRRWVDWKASARRMRLQTRVFTPTTLDSVVVALNVQTMEHAWQGYDADRFESAVSVAAAVLAQSVEAGCPVGLAVNGSGADSEGFQIFLPPNRRPSQLEDALATLAQLAPIPTLEFGTFLRRIAANFPYRTGLIVVSAYLDRALAEQLEALTHWGHHVSIVFVGPELPVAVDPRIAVVSVDDSNTVTASLAGAGAADA